MTPPRLVELNCPACSQAHWEIDCDFRDMDSSDEVPYECREYRCPHCERNGAGYSVGEKSPPAFFLQPHPLHPMEREEFDRWVAVLREHFPRDPMLQQLGKDWRPGKS